MYDITMPKLSDSMQEGKIIRWLVKEGEAVEEGQALAEIESDKATMELESFHAGTLASILKPDGAEAKVGDVIGKIATPDEAPKKQATPKPEPATKKPEKAVKEAPKKQTAEPKRPTAQPEKPSKAEPQAAPAVKETPETEAPAQRETPTTEEPKAETGRIVISPYARKLAEERGIDISKLKGSGPGGRIVAHDVEEAEAATAGAKAAPSAVKTAPAAEKSSDEELPPLEVSPDEADVQEAPYRMRTLAKRLTAAKRNIPHFYITHGVDVTDLFARKDELKQQHGATITHFIMAAALRALKEHPEVNRSYDRGKLFIWKGINLGLAVETDDGLTVAVLRNAQDMSMKDIVAGSKQLVEKARAGKLSAAERSHATFTISSLGMFDVEQFDAIINPPGSMILAVAAALEQPVVRNGKIAVGRVMKLTLSCDHRVVDGVQAARFMGDLRKHLGDVDALTK